MKKLTLSIGLVAVMLSTKAQDTICTMVRPHEVVEFNYSTDKVISRYNSKKTVIIEIGYQEILCLHLYDKKARVRKVITTLANGEVIVDVLDSKNNTYYSSLGTTKVEVRRPKLMILR